MVKSRVKKALIVGVSGQDGAYLSKTLINANYEVWGSSRNSKINLFNNLKELFVYEQVKKLSMIPENFKEVFKTIEKIMPDEIYNLSGQSSVGLSFEKPLETSESIILCVLNILESIRLINKKIKFYNAGSSEIFGDIKSDKACEDTIFSPKSPYAASKAHTIWQVKVYRESYDLFACSGILFNHESPFRHEKYVTRKIISSVCRIANGSSEKLILGNIKIKRDWGWAPEYVHAMKGMLSIDKAEDFVISTGVSNTLEDFVELAFKNFGLNYKDYIIIDEKLFRPNEIMYSCGDPSKAKEFLNWSPKIRLDQIVQKLITSELERK